MHPHTEELRESFKALQKSARSYHDIYNWFRQHPECLPNVPPELVSNIKIVAPSTAAHATQHTKSRLFVYDIGMSYRAAIPQYSPPEVSAADFKTLLGATVGPSNNSRNGLDQGFRQDMRIGLDPAVWPFAAAMVVKDWLDASHWIVHVRENDMEIFWSTHFTHHSWATLCSFRELGMLPKTPYEFVCWACGDEPVNQPTMTGVTTELSPT